MDRLAGVGRRFAPSAQGWSSSSAGWIALKSPDPHRGRPGPGISIGGMSDHAHLLLALPTSLSVGQCDAGNQRRFLHLAP